MSNIISRIRRNHGLEHACVHVLTEKFGEFGAQGNSTHEGFYLNIFGELPDGAVESAVYEAHARMKAGEHHLAVHPNCGTVLLTMATIGAALALIPFAYEQKRHKTQASALFNSFSTSILGVVVGIIMGKPLGIQLQEKYTVEGDLQEMEIVAVKRIQPNIVSRTFQFLLRRNPQHGVQSFKIVTVN